MKKILTIAILSFLVLSCKQEDKIGYIIDGTAQGIKDGNRVYLKSIDQKGELAIHDTATISAEKFKIQGSIEEPTIRFLSVDGLPGELIFMLENSKIDISINSSNIMQSVVSGSESNASFKAFEIGMDSIRNENKAILVAYRKSLNSTNTAEKDSIYNELQKFGDILNKYPNEFINANNDSYFSLNLVNLEANKPKVDLDALKESFNNLSPRLKASPKGIKTNRKLDSLYTEYQNIAHLEIGKIAPNFEAPTPTGNLVSFNDLKGKVTLINFWAAWCLQCRNENSNIVRVYEKYHSQGFEIIGVSLDGQSTQNNPKQSWLDAIEQDQLAWPQVSYLKYFNDPVAQLYNVKTVPANYLIDKDGNIAYKNLIGKALELKVQELLEKE